MIRPLRLKSSELLYDIPSRIMRRKSTTDVLQRFVSERIPDRYLLGIQLLPVEMLNSGKLGSDPVEIRSKGQTDSHQKSLSSCKAIGSTVR